ncbi:hypothetical protein DPMN_040325 [Dreissena polymorpha]|uniref:Uncharacterized protein n=1 Tax=Dreissena polymorpha TaxID=45954 RepID=A0A9D4HWR8_DREPO|nr:hypothetical protein DPMN_040325 [Dreissena polymorpha]
MCIAGLVDFLTPSQTVSGSPAGAQLVLAPSQTVYESLACASPVCETVLAPSQTVWGSYAGASPV